MCGRISKKFDHNHCKIIVFEVKERALLYHAKEGHCTLNPLGLKLLHYIKLRFWDHDKKKSIVFLINLKKLRK